MTNAMSSHELTGHPREATRRREAKAWILAGIVVLGTLSLASPLAAADKGAKTALSIETIVRGNLNPFGSGTAAGTFTLDLGPSSDSGKLTLKYTYGSLKRTGAGQTFRTGERTETLKGKYGTLVIHTIGRQFPVGVENPRDPQGDSEVWLGAWSISRGTGRYAGLKGGGGAAGIIEISLGIGISMDYFHRYEGLVTRS
jgi:hypothetical protein